MKQNITSLLFVLGLLAGHSDATMTPHYSTYTNVVYNADHTVTFTGTLQGNSTNDSGACPGFNPPYFYHSPGVWVNNVASTGNQPVAPCAYVNISQSAVLSGSCLTTGTGCTVPFSASVYCSFLKGNIFDWSSVFQLEAATTRVISYGPQTGCYQTGTGTNCYYPVNDWCSPATTPPDNNLNGTTLKDAWPITFPAVWDAIAACYRINYPLFTGWSCSGAIAYIISQGNPVASQLDCTHNPR